MHRENRLDARENGRPDGPGNIGEDARPDDRDREPTRDQLADFRRFTDSHPEIAEQLRKDPAIGKDGDFVDQHPALHDYFRDHPDVRQEFADNPDIFMRQNQDADQQTDRDDRTRIDDFNGLQTVTGTSPTSYAEIPLL
jgi:hypothetical protein